MSGELCAIRPSLVKRIPPNLATDEPYMEMLIRNQGRRVVYVPDAITYIKGPDNFREILEQRRRIWTGHLQIKRMTGFVVSTSKLKNVLPILMREILRFSIKKLLWILLGVILEIYAYLLARHDLSKGRIPYKWKKLKSTKTPRILNGSHH